MNEAEFRAKVLLRIEQIGKTHLGDSFYSSDDLSLGKYCEGMIQILERVFINDNDKEALRQFYDHCNDYLNYPIKDIPKDDRELLNEEFSRLYEISRKS